MGQCNTGAKCAVCADLINGKPYHTFSNGDQVDKRACYEIYETTHPRFLPPKTKHYKNKAPAASAE